MPGKGPPWSDAEDSILIEMREADRPAYFKDIARAIQINLGTTRTKNACISRWYQLDIIARAADAQGRATEQRLARLRYLKSMRSGSQDVGSAAVQAYLTKQQQSRVRSRDNMRRLRAERKAQAEAKLHGMDLNRPQKVDTTPRRVRYSTSWTSPPE